MAQVPNTNGVAEGSSDRGPVIVALGASAGGLEALKTFFHAVPRDSGLAFVVIQHMWPHHDSSMAELLAHCSDIPVTEIEEDVRVEANHAYVIPPNRQLDLDGGVLTLSPASAGGSPRMRIDHFFVSLAQHNRPRSIAVVLSGTGSDGTEGAKSIKEAGGIVIAQAASDCAYSGMPHSVVKAGLADEQMMASDMPAILVAYARQGVPEAVGADSALTGDDEINVRRIVDLLSRKTDNDFSCYKDGTVMRRVFRRMGLSHVTSVADYYQRLKETPEEVEKLSKDLLITVTSFFRSPDAFEALASEVIEPLTRSASREDVIRVWIPGCATGEEAYSLAILFHEALNRNERMPALKIYATDIDEQALEVAREGVYAEGIKEVVSPARLATFFHRENGCYRIASEIREQITFARQNVIYDAPFSRMDLISCRNLLIYIEPETQKKLMQLFHFSLRNTGYLFLGGSENIGGETGLFTAVDQRHRIYQRIATTRKLPSDLPLFPRPWGHGEKEGYVSRAPGSPRRSTPLSERVQRFLANHYAPPSVLVSQEGQTLYVFGDTAPFLKLPPGEPNQDIFAMAHRGLKSELRNLFRDAVTRNERVEVRNVRGGDRDEAIDLVMAPIDINQTRHYLISFEAPSRTGGNQKREDTRTVRGSDDNQQALIEHLEDELQSTRLDLQGTIEELEVSNEDMKVAHEEALSMNEELQSANEELETSKEELQSLNEELTTVNSELETKVGQLDKAYKDLDNLLKSVDAAILFLDPDYRIRMFTPSSKALFNVVDTDIGRSLEEVKCKADEAHLFEDIDGVLASGENLEREVQTQNGDWYMRRVRFYKDSSEGEQGVVLVYTEVTRLKSTQEELAELTGTLEARVEEQALDIERYYQERERAARQQDAFFELSPMPLFIADENGHFERLNAVWSEDFGWPVEELRRTPVMHRIHPEDRVRFQQALDEQPSGGGIRQVQARFQCRDGSYFSLEWDIKRSDEGDLFGVVRDVTERVMSEQALDRAEEEIERKVQQRTRELDEEKERAEVTLMSIGESVITTDSEGRINNMNPTAERVTGIALETVRDQPVDEVFRLYDEDTGEPINCPVITALRKKKSVTYPQHALLQRSDGTLIHIEESVSPIYDTRGDHIGAVLVFFDVSYTHALTRRIQHQASHDALTGLVNRREMETRLQRALESSQDPGKYYTLMFLDLDQFKIVNDACGHQAGDELLRQITAELEQHVRQRDTLGRMGGDEFVLLLEGCNAEQATLVANEIRDAVRAYRFSWEGESFSVGVSIGIAEVDASVQSVEQLLHNTDTACYLAKEFGRDRIHIFNAEESDTRERYTQMQWASRVSQALDSGSITLLGQPITSLASGEQTGEHIEVLVRLEESDGQLVSPASFINAAERYNLMPRLDRYVVRRVFEWLARNPEFLKSLDVCAINLSAHTLEDERFADYLAELLETHGLCASQICFEITETLAIRHLSKTIKLAETFKRMGFYFALDDFGSGFASYHYLKRLPVDFLKIDGEFVRGLLDDPVDEAMVTSMNQIGHIMGKKTIAEYVESDEIMEKLREIGVDYVQGYRVGKPGRLFN